MPEPRSLADDLRVPILEESLDVSTRTKITGIVRLEKSVETLVASVDEELASESISVERVPVNRYLDEVATPRQEGDIFIVPVMEEIVIVTKQLVLKEELWITRRRQQSHYHEAVPLRAETVKVSRLAPDDLNPE